MKHLYILFSFVMVSLFVVEPLQAQQEITIRELNTYDAPITDQADLADHPLVDELVTFDAVVISYPRNSGLATPDDGPSEAEPGRIHLFVTDVNAITEGREGMSMQLVVAGAQQRTLETLDRGDVISVTGSLTFYGNESQFDASGVDYLGSIALNEEYADLAPLLEPLELSLTDVNQATEDGNTWVSENYSKYIHTYVKFTGLEMINRLAGADGNRPWFVMSDGSTMLMTSDISLRYRNDRGTYGFKVEEDGGVQDTVLSLNYNYRRKAEELDGIFNPPAPGSVVDISGFLVLDDFDPNTIDANGSERTFRIVPWEDGIRWTADGDDVANRITTGIPNDLVVQGYAPIIDNLIVTPDSGIASTDEVELSFDVLLPENDYTINSVELQFSAYDYTEDTGDTTNVTLTGSGSYSHTFSTYDDFTIVDYTIVANAETPDGVQTTARESGSFSVESATQTSPVVFTPAPNEAFLNSVNVELSTATANSEIYYTLDGSTPDENSTLYSDEITLTETTTINAIAVGSGLTASPVNERTYTVEVEVIESATLAGIRTGSLGDIYSFTGEAVVTYVRPASGRNQKYLMDSSGGLLIDDSDGIITPDFAIGDVISGVRGELGAYGGIAQLIPTLDVAAPTETAEVVPVSITLADLNLDEHESMLVKVEGVSFVETGSFEAGKNYNLTDATLTGEETVLFRTNFGEADYIGTDIPSGTFNLTAIVGGYNGTPQLIARSLSDFESSSPIENELPLEFSLKQNYPNPFNPTTNILFSVAEIADVNLVVYDILGRKVATLVNEVKTPGNYMINFNASSLSSGAYFYRLEAGSFVSIRKMMLIK